MANSSDPNESTTRANLAYIFAIGAIIMLGYILYRWGDQKEILTLVIGLIGGTLLGGVVGVYFGGTTNKKDQSTITGDINNQPTDSTNQAAS